MGGGYNRGGYQQPPQPHPLPGSYPGGAGYPQGGMPGQPYGGFQGGGRGSMMGGGGMRGGNMGMRGGRGGGQMNGMMGMPMNMGGMPGQMGMGMPQMNAGMGMQGTYPASTFASHGLLPQHFSVSHPSPQHVTAGLEHTHDKKKKKRPPQAEEAPEAKAPKTVATALRWLPPSARSDPSLALAHVFSPLEISMRVSAASESEPASNPTSGFPNPGFFPQQTDANWNPHGAKRTRQE